VMTNFPRLLWYLAGAIRRLYWDSQKLRKYQEKRLRSVVRYAYNFVPFYHGKIREAGISPSDIKTLEDLSKLPIIRKDEFRLENPRRLVSVEFDIEKLKVVRTSGSSGKPFQLYINSAEDDWRKAIYMRANISCGQKPRDNWVAITAPHHFLDTTNTQRRLGIFAQTCISVFADINEQMRLVNEAKPDILDGYSGSLLLLAKGFQKGRVETIRPRIIFGTAELIDNVSRRFIEQMFNAPFYDQFGCSEVDRTAWQCPEKTGYHMDVDSVITQFVDDEGNDVSSGERGEIVYTSLFNYSMPLIRYAVGDIGVPSDEKCPCGRSLPLMEVVEGRKDSLLLLPDGQLLSPRTFTVALSMFELYNQIERFLVVQEKVDLFKIYIKKKDIGVNEDVLGSGLLMHFGRMLNSKLNEVKFDVKFVEDLPVNKTGKHRAVVSELKM